MTKNYILVTVSGPDKPGITSSLMNVIVKDHVQIRDMGQSITHGFLSLSFLLDFNNHSEYDASQNFEQVNDFTTESPVLKDLLFEAKKMGMLLEFDVINDEEQLTPRGPQYILSCVAQKNIKASFIKDISTMLAQNSINIRRIENTGSHDFTKLEISCACPANFDEGKFKGALIDISHDHQIDLAFLRDNVYRRSKRLIVFDMDSTLIQTEVVDELADIAGAGAKVRDITERAMNGELDFNQSLIERVSNFKGMSEKKLAEVADRLPLTPGVEEFIDTVKRLGYKVAVISGGFTYFANYLKDKLKLDFAFANELEIVNGELTGKVKGTIINAEQKAVLLDLIAQQEGISLEQVVAIGDGANDLLMLSKAGLGIAFHAKDVVKQKASHSMSHGPMTSVLHFLGINQEIN